MLVPGLILALAMSALRPANGIIAAPVKAHALSGTPGQREARINALVRAIDDRTTARDWEKAESLLREMAAIDPDHPKVYLRAVILERDREPKDRADLKATLLMDALGPKDGPGRTYGDAFMAFTAGHIEEGTQGFTQALERYESLKHAAGQAACHSALGNVATRVKDPALAARHFEAASGFLDGLGDRAGAADVLLSTAEALLGARRPADASGSALKAIAIREEIGGPRDLARAFSILGRCRRAEDLFPESLAAYQRSLELRRQAKDGAGEAATETEIAKLHQEKGEFTAAVEHQRKAIALSEALKDTKELAREYRGLGDILVDADQPRDAEAAYKKSAELYGELKNGSNEARVLNALGKTRITLGELRVARDAFERALAQARLARDLDAEAGALTGLGNVSLASGDLARGLLLEEQALQRYREAEDGPGELGVLNNLGAAYFQLGDLPQARSYMDLALAKATKTASRWGEALARSNLAVLLGAQGSYTPALEEARKAEALYTEDGNERESARSRANAAEMLLRLGRIGEASTAAASALADYMKSGDLDGQANARNLIGEVRWAQGASGDAMSAHRDALELAQEVDSPAQRERAHAGLSAALESSGDRKGALKEMLAAIDEVERMRARLITQDLKMRFFSGQVDRYERAVALALPARPRASAGPSRAASPAELALAFEIVERSRARSLLDALVPSAPAKAASEEIEKQRQEARDTLGEALARLSRSPDRAARSMARHEVESARAAVERTEIQIGSKAGARASSAPEAHPITLAKLQQSVLRKDEGMLEYFIGESQAWVFSITKGSASVRTMDPPRAVAERAAAFLKATSGASASVLGPGDPLPERAAAEALAAVVVPAGLPKGSRLLVVPDGPLRHVPFEALRTHGRFLIETHEVTVVPSATALAALRGMGPRLGGETDRSRAGFLGVADPTIEAGKGMALTPLPFARREVEGIAALFPEGDRKVLLGDDATRSKFLDAAPGGSRYVHFATHGWLDPESPRNTGLRLGGEGSGGALLGVEDILSLSLSADLVVVSACSSAQGEALRGEGLTGLTRAFLNAGSRAVVVSLWDVPDRSTADLMVDFYGGLTRGQGASAALRASKLRFLASKVPGRDRILRWAPFILVGDPGEGRTASNATASGATH